ncbi:hypothetical protein E2562_027936 [Oryza meyeriana var. granulata]|uniref:Uncharacterized protein n=1 Tax=Oryza meyeriana var. granulata TaxID=110450 RepID=A0A6G1CTU8_9ORYZ|nr:hypothetical protein E2562_027936 [Oryza meyeriana var. granulata]
MAAPPMLNMSRSLTGVNGAAVATRTPKYQLCLVYTTFSPDLATAARGDVRDGVNIISMHGLSR